MAKETYILVPPFNSLSNQKKKKIADKIMEKQICDGDGRKEEEGSESWDGRFLWVWKSSLFFFFFSPGTKKQYVIKG